METQNNMEKMRQKYMPDSNVKKKEINNAFCPDCGGKGYILVKAEADWLEEVYGDRNFDAQPVIKKCPTCNGFMANHYDEDLTCAPSRYREADMTKFKWDCYKTNTEALEQIAKSYVRKWEECRNDELGLYLWSKTPGSGKTFLACCIGKSIMMKYGITMKFVTAPEFCEKCSEKKANEKSGNFLDPTKTYYDCDLLILDDIGAQSDTKWNGDCIFNLINTRMNKSKITIYTSNLIVDNVSPSDPRIPSRIDGKTIKMHLPEESIRSKISAEKNNEFLNKLLSD